MEDGIPQGPVSCAATQAQGLFYDFAAIFSYFAAAALAHPPMQRNSSAPPAIRRPFRRRVPGVPGMTVEQMQDVVKEQQRTRMNLDTLRDQVNILQQNVYWLQASLFRLQHMVEKNVERRLELEAAAEAAEVEAFYLNGGKGKGKGKNGKGKRKGY